MGLDADLVIIGMGSAGLVAAPFARRLGLRVIALERHRVGGDCLWTGCVPSKALLSAAKAAHTMRRADAWGLDPVDPQVDLDRVLARVRAVQETIAHGEDDPDKLRDDGVDLRIAEARVVGPHTVLAGRRPVTARHLLVCTGSRPAVPPIPGLKEAGYLTSESLWEVERMPRSIVAIGAGPITVEIGQALARLGAGVTVLESADRVLPRDEPALVDLLTERVRAEGVDLRVGAEVLRAERLGEREVVVHARIGGREEVFRAEAVVLGTGRSPNVEGLGLEEVGVRVGEGGIEVDGAQRTSVPSIWAAGDVAGGPQFTHAAGAQAVRAIRNAFFPGTDSSPYGVPWTTFTDPELAHAGLTEAQARERGLPDVRVWRSPLEASDRAQAERDTHGEVRLVTSRGRLVGAHVLSHAAGELIGELALAAERGMKLHELAGVVHVYPTLSLTVQRLAGEAAMDRAARLRFLARL